MWELVTGADPESKDTLKYVEARRKWNIRLGKAIFALRISITIRKEYIDPVCDVSSPKQVWDTFEKLFSKTNTTKLQLLENELERMTQDGLSISEYFLKSKLYVLKFHNWMIMRNFLKQSCVG